MRILFIVVIFAFAAPAAAIAQMAPVVHANVIIPKPAPVAPITNFVNADGRTTMVVEGEGATLRGWKYRGADAAAPTVVFFNGNAGTIDASDPFYRTLAALGPTIVAFDYRGYGFSTGIPDVAAFQADGVRIVDTVAFTDKSHPVVVCGFSLGTAIATYVAARRTIAGLILAAPFPSAKAEFPTFAKASGIPDAIAATIEIAPDAVDAFAEADNVAKSKAPLLVLHGTDDREVPVALGRDVLAASASPRKLFVELPGTGHNDTLSRPAALAAIRAFIASLKP